jgi:hypothetical protein
VPRADDAPVFALALRERSASVTAGVLHGTDDAVDANEQHPTPLDIYRLHRALPQLGVGEHRRPLGWTKCPREVIDHESTAEDKLSANESCARSGTQSHDGKTLSGAPASAEASGKRAEFEQ